MVLTEDKAYTYLCCDYFNLNITKESGNKKYLCVGKEISDDSICDRLTKCKDIVCVDIFFSDDEKDKECINLIWDEQGEYCNKYQTVTVINDKITITCKK